MHLAAARAFLAAARAFLAAAARAAEALEVFAGEDVYAGLRPESLLNILAIATVDEYLYPGLRPEV